MTCASTGCEVQFWRHGPSRQRFCTPRCRAHPLLTKTCPNCGGEFNTRFKKRKIFCSVKCKKHAAHLRDRERWETSAAEVERLRIQVEQGKAAEARLEEMKKSRLPVAIGPDRIVMNKPGPTPDDERGAYAAGLQDQGLKRGVIKERVEAHFRIHTSKNAIDGMIKRWRGRQPKVNEITR